MRLSPSFVEIHARSLAARENSPQPRPTLHGDGQRRSDLESRTRTVHVCLEKLRLHRVGLIPGMDKVISNN